MYTVTVPQVTIYLDAELAGRVKQEDVPVSAVCQRALRAELARIASGRPPEPIPGQMRIDNPRSQ